MLSKVADTISGIFTSLSVGFLCCLHLFCENIRKENGVTQLMCHNRFSDCCVALHPSAGISTEINGNARCCGGLLDLQQAVTCNVNSPRRSNSTSRRKSGEIFEVQLHASVNSNKNSCIIVYDKCIARYRWRQAAESQNENTSWHFMVPGGSTQLKQRKVKHCALPHRNEYPLAFLLLASTTNNAYYCDCWCEFGKEFSSDNAGDGPVSELNSPPSQHYIECALSRYKYDTYVRNVSHPEGETQSCDHDKD